MIPSSRPWIEEEECHAVTETLRSGMLVQGQKVQAFEHMVAARVGRQYAIAVSSGTAAISLALQALGIGEGDDVLCPGLSWPSPAHAICAVGAQPILTDVDPHEWNATAAAFENVRTPKTRAIIAIDQFGNPVRFKEIRQAFPELLLIEDAACALGSRLLDTPCGNFGAVSCMSFHPRKIITTGEGGMCLTDDPNIAQHLRILRNHGQESPGQFRAPSGNFRLTDMAAAIGIVQMKRLDDILANYRRCARRYIQRLPQLRFQHITKHSVSNYQTMGAVLPNQMNAIDFVNNMQQDNIQIGRLSYSLDKIGSLHHAGPPLTQAQHIAKQGIALPLYATMTHTGQDQIIRTLLKHLS